jgi:hypothetical protein
MRLVVLVAVCAGGCIVPYAIPPLRGELGGVSTIGGGAGMHAALGTHVASATRRPDQAFDLGTGVVYEKTDERQAGGGYVEASWFVDRDGNLRASTGLRNELRWTPEGTAFATKARFDMELFTAAKGELESDTKCGVTAAVAHGTSAFGLFAEAGHVWLPDGHAFVATAGVTVRVPAVFGVWIGIPGC